MTKETKDPITIVPSKPCIGIDVDCYQAAIDDPDVSEDRKRELIEVIGAIVVQFIDLGFGVHSVQLAEADKAEGQKQKNQAEKESKQERIDA